MGKVFRPRTHALRAAQSRQTAQPPPTAEIIRPPAELGYSRMLPRLTMTLYGHYDRTCRTGSWRAAYVAPCNSVVIMCARVPHPWCDALCK
jgi:hypothetical protein